MPQVKVWNDNIHPFETVFKGDKVKIPAKSFIEMDLYEANDLRGQYHPTYKDGSGLQDPKSYKMIRVEPVGPEAKEPAQMFHVCMSCKHKSPSPEELEAHIKFRHANDTRLELPEEDARAEAILPKKKANNG